MSELVDLRIIERSDWLHDPERAHAHLTSEDGAIILVNKPYGETSFHVVNRIRRGITESTGIKWVKVGHAGTLDPLATGLLLIATRRHTKKIDSLMGLDKTYGVTLRLGVTSASYDLEQPIEIVGGVESLRTEDVERVLAASVGEHQQVPPIFSAIKQEGRPVYHRARRGDEVQLEPRSIFVRSIDTVSVQLPFVSFTVACSKGTYIRSLVRDIGLALDTGAVLTALSREQVGTWLLKNSLELEEAVELARPQRDLHLTD